MYKKSEMHVQSCWFTYQTLCFWRSRCRLVGGSLSPSCFLRIKRKWCHLTFWRKRHVDAYARWKSKQSLAVVSLPSYCSVQPGKTTAHRVHNRLTKHGNLFARDAFYGLQSSFEIMTVQWGSFSILNNANLLKRQPLVKLMFKELGFLLYYRFWKTNLQVKKIYF